MKPSVPMKSSRELQEFIDTSRIEATILAMAEHTSTVEDAARALAVDSIQIIKSLVFRIDGKPLLVINSGPARVDRRKIATYLGVGRKRVKFASAEEALQFTGFVVGSMPPFGHAQKLRTLVHEEVMHLDMVYGGGGDIDAMMKMTPEELIRVTEAEMADISE